MVTPLYGIACAASLPARVGSPTENRVGQTAYSVAAFDTGASGPYNTPFFRVDREV